MNLVTHCSSSALSHKQSQPKMQSKIGRNIWSELLRLTQQITTTDANLHDLLNVLCLSKIPLVYAKQLEEHRREYESNEGSTMDSHQLLDTFNELLQTSEMCDTFSDHPGRKIKCEVCLPATPHASGDKKVTKCSLCNGNHKTSMCTNT